MRAWIHHPPGHGAAHPRLPNGNGTTNLFHLGVGEILRMLGSVRFETGNARHGPFPRTRGDLEMLGSVRFETERPIFLGSDWDSPTAFAMDPTSASRLWVFPRGS